MYSSSSQNGFLHCLSLEMIKIASRVNLVISFSKSMKLKHIMIKSEKQVELFFHYKSLKKGHLTLFQFVKIWTKLSD